MAYEKTKPAFGFLWIFAPSGMGKNRDTFNGQTFVSKLTDIVSTVYFKTQFCTF